MGDIVVLASNVTVVDSMATSGSYWQPVKDVIDISAYDRLDVQAVLVGMKGSGGAGSGVEVALYTSMLNDVESDAGWVEVVAPVYISGAAGTPEWGDLIAVYSSTVPLYRFLRWRLFLKTGTTSATISLSGIARTL